MYDILLHNARILDGTGNPWFYGNIGITDQRIAHIGNVQGEASQNLDVDGLIVCPGFIDIHSHADLQILACPQAQNKIQQGVTTEATGNCGQSMAPVNPDTLEQLQRYLGLSSHDLDWDWNSLDQFWKKAENQGLTTNIAPLVGQGTVRNAVMGFAQQKPDQRELDQMKRLVSLAMQEGAFGLSSGLIYPPGLFTEADEMIELARIVHQFDGMYASHVRSETGNIVQAYEEAIQVGRVSGVKVQISHHKTCGRDNWGKTTQTLQRIEEARRSGFDVTCDQYPYTAACTHLSAFLPPWSHEGGVPALLERLQSPFDRNRIKQWIQDRDDWENGIKQVGWDRIVISRVACDEDQPLQGRNLQEIVQEKQSDPFEWLFDFLLRNQADVRIFSFGVCEEDLCQVMQHPSTMIGTDGGAVPEQPDAWPHPRNYGVYPKILGEYVRQKQILTLEEAIRKMTSFPAQKLGLHDRGLIRTGNWADLVIFDPNTIIDGAGYHGTSWKPEGIHAVLVNGTFVVRNGEFTGQVPGQVLRHAAFASSPPIQASENFEYSPAGT